MPEFKPFGRQTIARDALARVRDHARRHVEPDDLRHPGARREGLHDVADARTDLHDGCGGRDLQPREKAEDLVDVAVGARLQLIEWDAIVDIGFHRNERPAGRFPD
jgi:hypothetical protein